MEQAGPDEVYNLGAISFVAYSWENAMLTTDVTAKGVLNVLEAVRLYSHDDPSKVRFYQASSSEMFGKVQDVPQKESTLLWPRSPYGVAKVFGHYMTINYRESYGMHASSGILFNHESPRRGPEFVTGRSRSPSRGSPWGCSRPSPSATSTPAATGASRATTSTRCGGWCSSPRPTTTSWPPARRTRSASSSTWRSPHVGIDDWEKHVVQDPRFFRPAEVDLLIGDPTKAREVLGWKPTVDFPGLVTMMVDNDLAIEGATTQVRS